MLGLTADWAFVFTLKGTALKTDSGSEQCLLFCGDCGAKDGDCQGKSNYAGQIKDSVVPILGGDFLMFFKMQDEGWNNDNLCQSRMGL